MEKELLESFYALRTVSWRRAFLTNPSLQAQVHQQISADLATDLANTVREVAEALHPEQSIKLSADQRQVELSDRRGSITTCFINTSNVGSVHLQFASRDGSEVTDTLRLDCVGEKTYVWMSGGVQIPPNDLAKYLLHKLAQHAASVLQRETRTASQAVVGISRII